MKCGFAVKEFTITEFKKKKECNAEWVSPPFYSHPHGQFRLAVYPNGLQPNLNTHMSVCVLLEGNDDPAWTLEAMIVIQFVDWRTNHRGVAFDVQFNSVSRSNAVTKRSTSLDEPHSSLCTDDAEYLKNDCIRLRVLLDDMLVFLYPTALLSKTPSWQISSNGDSELTVLEFTLAAFSKRMELSHILYECPAFYTHGGYKFHLQVNIEGDYIVDHEEDRCISFILSLLPGEHDNQLKWPFVGEFDVTLLNWREDENHYTYIYTADSFSQVVKGDHGECIWEDQFIPHSMLAYNSVTNTEYLQDDCLRFRVSMNTSD